MRTPGAGGRGGVADGSGVEKDRPLTAEDRIIQLEAENLRLRFRVADLEGQVNVKVVLLLLYVHIYKYLVARRPLLAL